METPLVSIIVPVYNVAIYLPACIDSLVNQTYPHIEVILVDDGSTDASLAVLQGYAQRDKRIRVVSQVNAGAGAARNRGLDMAGGAYVLFVDGDDWIDLHTVEACMTEALATDADIVCFGFRKVKKAESFYSFEYTPGCFSADDHLNSFFAENSARTEQLNTATMGKLYKRSLLERHNIRFRLPVFEDTPFFLEAIYHAGKITRIPGALYCYFIREKDVTVQSTTGATVSADKISKFYAADKWMKDFLVRMGIFRQYKLAYYRFHNARVLLYGGYFETYVYTTGNDYMPFIGQLRKNRQDITFHRKGLYKAYWHRVHPMNIGLWLSFISARLAHRYFVRHERKMARK